MSGEADSSPPIDGDQDPSLEPEGNTPEGEAEPDEKKATDEDKPKDKTARRIEKLLKERDNFRKELANARQQAEREKVRLSLALKTVMGKLQERESRLSQYEDLGTADERLAEIERQQQVRSEYSEREKRLAEQFEQQQAEQVNEEARSLVEDAVADVLEEFPHLSDAQLRAKLAEHVKANPDAMVSDAVDLFRQFAREIDQDLEKLYEQRVLKKHGPRLSAPKPTAGTGTMGVRGSFSSLDEIIADAEQRFGERMG